MISSDAVEEQRIDVEGSGITSRQKNDVALEKITAPCLDSWTSVECPQVTNGLESTCNHFGGTCLGGIAIISQPTLPALAVYITNRIRGTQQ